MRALFALILLVTPATAETADTLRNHIAPRYERLVSETAALAAAAKADCTPDALKPVYHDAFDAWISVSHIQFGPIETQGLGLAMSFWPDPKNRTGKALQRLVAARDPIVDDPDAWAEVSVAAQGFTALERMLFDDPAVADADYACRLTQAIALGLAQKAAAIEAGWPGFAALMRDVPNPRFQSEPEVQRALYTALSTGLEFLHDQRLGRPLGSFDRPRPQRAEARRSGRSLRHVIIALAALEDLALRLSDSDLPKTRAAFAYARLRAGALADPVFAGVAAPVPRLRIEALQSAVAQIQEAVVAEIGMPMGVTGGFNALDGD